MPLTTISCPHAPDIEAKLQDEWSEMTKAGEKIISEEKGNMVLRSVVPVRKYAPSYFSNGVESQKVEFKSNCYEGYNAI